MAHLLVVDDEPNVLYSLVRALESDALAVDTAQTGQQAIDTVRTKKPDAVILDVRLPDMSGLDVFERLHSFEPQLPVIIITAFASTETAIEAMKRGAFEYLLKPVDLHQLREVVARALDLSRLRQVTPVFGEEEDGGCTERIVGRCPGMQEIYKAIGRVAPRDVPVLITGESGTGKELVARALFHHGSRSSAPFLAINAAAIPENLLESELFGHERGAFTGADRRRIGKFEQCNNGTLFLDEIGDMPLAIQAKVLRLLQEQRFERLGGNETIETDVRLIAATNKDLEAEVAAGRFRKDLVYRLNVFTIKLPPLRERGEDLPLLIDHFLRRFSRTLDRAVNTITPEARRCLEEYTWPGNIRELQSVLKYALIQTPGDVLTLESLPENLRRPGLGPVLPLADAGLDIAAFAGSLLRAGETDIYRRVCLEVDRVVLETVLNHACGNQVQASELLGISRTTLRAKLRALGQQGEKPAATEIEQLAAS